MPTCNEGLSTHLITLDVTYVRVFLTCTTSMFTFQRGGTWEQDLHGWVWWEVDLLGVDLVGSS